MASFTLDDIRAAAEAAYGSTDIDLGAERVRLLNPLRMAREKRSALLDTQNRLNEDDADQESILEDLLVLVAETESQGEKLVEAIGGDLAVLIKVFERYSEGTQVGEASASLD